MLPKGGHIISKMRNTRRLPKGPTDGTSGQAISMREHITGQIAVKHGQVILMIGQALRDGPADTRIKHLDGMALAKTIPGGLSIAAKTTDRMTIRAALPGGTNTEIILRGGRRATTTERTHEAGMTIMMTQATRQGGVGSMATLRDGNTEMIRSLVSVTSNGRILIQRDRDFQGHRATPLSAPLSAVAVVLTPGGLRAPSARPCLRRCRHLWQQLETSWAECRQCQRRQHPPRRVLGSRRGRRPRRSRWPCRGLLEGRRRVSSCRARAATRHRCRSC